MEKILEVKGLTKIFGNDFAAASNIDFELKAGEIIGIVGESGSGKSTIARMIMGLVKPTRGDILFKGKSLLKLSRSERKALSREMQMVFQDPIGSFSPRMKDRDILLEPLNNFKFKDTFDKEARIREVLKLVQLDEVFLERYAKEMSGGQAQRVAIARALTISPSLLIFDEATSALDVSIQAEIVELIKELQKKLGFCIIWICHDMALVDEDSDKIIIMYKGQMVEKIESGNILQEAVHPYTKNLLNSVFELKTGPRCYNENQSWDSVDGYYIPKTNCDVEIIYKQLTPEHMVATDYKK